MINHDHKFIFIHVPRTAGHSIHKALNYNVHPPYIDDKNREIDHYRASDYKETVSSYDSFFKFSFVRNPWSKMASEFVFLKHGTAMWRPNPNRMVYPKDLDFSTFVRLISNKSFSDYTHFQKSHFIPQVDYFTIDGVLDLNFIGRFENLQQDFDIVCDKIGIPRQQLPHKNKSNHKHYTEYYDNETRQIVAEKYARDIEYFGYKFGK